ncbi:hypothetical protein ED733_003508 [Metarhizium rileyi]|uniref:Major facilitator superfamily domain, general substrate transporter n=1 Tax=Metarhizium rileyi (strain RCEF 4871) TaxID=1649241 RepID=A0A5C6GL04_METRR|nr:hypothetical protein ED733_003508 [Metarhizium rileyi]
MPLVIALAIAILGTLFVAAATSVRVIYAGRVLQSIGATAAWIIGVATLRTYIDGENMAWGSVFVVMAVNIAMRLVMLECPRETISDEESSKAAARQPEEDSPLIPDTDGQGGSALGEATTREPIVTSATAFYSVILTQKRVIVSILCSIIHSVVLASYGTTLPTHVKFAFGWDSLPTGLLFAVLQVPIILASPLYGSLRDRFGTRKPTSAGFASLAPLLWLLGAADQTQFPWAASENSAKFTYVAAFVGIGCVTNLTSTVSAFEITRQ